MKKNNLVELKKKDDLPEVKNPLHDLINGNMPGLPSIIQNSMPVELPRASFGDGSLSLFFGNIKRKQLVKSVKAEAEIAEHSRNSVHSKLEMIHELVTFSARTANSFQEYEHLQHMRRVAEEQASLTTNHMELLNENQQLQNYKLQTECSILGWEAKSAELDAKMKEKQFNEMIKEE